MSTAGKRKAGDAAAGAAAGAAPSPATKKKAPAPASAGPSDALVNPKRWRALNDAPVKPGPVIYWMSRDQRMRDNWALLHAVGEANARGQPAAVAFNLVPEFLGAGARQFVFMLAGLRELAPRLQAAGVPFFLLRGDPAETVPGLARAVGAGLVVTDYSPLRLGVQWRSAVARALAGGGGGSGAGSGSGAGIAVREVDAHNVVPVWAASDKREYAARTIRPKIHAALPEFLTEFPPLPAIQAPWPAAAARQPGAIDWDALLAEVRARGAAVPEVAWCTPGEDGAAAALADFLSPQRLAAYADKRNDPGVAGALSNLSPWLHFGQLSAQRAALEAAKQRSVAKVKPSAEAFLEELVVRRELAENYCHHCPDTYDKLDAAYDWARDTLAAHAADRREHIYSRDQLERAETHDDLWNAAQREMLFAGKMHGWARMYWAKKILEWTPSAAEALEISIYLNDKYELDGRDPNGYVGCMWSIAGVHDMGWAERPVFGKIRYMNYAGAKRKFDIAKYVARVDGLARDARARGAVPAVLAGAGAAAGGSGGGGTSRGAGAGAASGGKKKK